MADRPLPRLVGNHLLTKVLETDPLGQVLRARRVAPGPAHFDLVRRFEAPGLDTTKLLEAAKSASPILGSLKGPGIAKGLAGFEGEGFVHLTSEWLPGHSLRRVLEKTTDEGFMVAIDQALLIADKVVSALDAASQFRLDDVRIAHRFVVPGFVWITDEGEVKLTGFGFGGAFLEMAKGGAFAASFVRYIAPEARGGGKPGKSSDVYSVAAILFELLTNEKVPVDVTPSVVAGAQVAHDGIPFPKDIGELVGRCLATDPKARPETISDLKKELSKILFAGNYAPTTFNLAFFMNTLFRGETETQEKEREQEAKLDPESFRPKPVAPAPKPAAPKEPPPPPPSFSGASTAEPPKSKTGLFAGIAVAAIVVGVVGWYVMTKKPSSSGLAGPGSGAASPTTSLQQAATAMDPAAFEEAVRKRVAEELQKIEEAKKSEQDPQKKKEQEARIASLKAQQDELIKKQVEAKQAEEARKVAAAAPVKSAGAAPGGATPPAPAGPTPEELARKQREADEAARKLEASLKVSASAAPAPAPAPSTPPKPTPVETSPASPSAATKEGDMVDPAEVDDMPVAQVRVRPEYPRVAKMRRSEGIVILSLLVNEKGRVDQVKVLRKAADSLLDEAATKAAKDWTYLPGKKDGKKIKTWVTETVPFKL
jgi:TonB family protein